MIRILIGYLLAIGVIVGAIALGGDFRSFIDIPSVIIVIGGMIALVLMGQMAPSKNNLSKRILFELMTLAFMASAMLGDFIGAIQMLANLTNPESIGPSMAVCLLTSLYGLIMMLFVSGPLEDQSLKKAENLDELSLSQVAWGLFPLYSILFGLMVFFILFFSLKLGSS